MRTISVPALRRLVVTAQGYVPRARRAGAEDVESAIRRASCIQLDSVSAVERSHRIAIASRAGVYPQGLVPELLCNGRIIEYWAHALCLLPTEDWPLFAWARETHARRGSVARRRQDPVPGAGGSACSLRSASAGRSDHVGTGGDQSAGREGRAGTRCPDRIRDCRARETDLGSSGRCKGRAPVRRLSRVAEGKLERLAVEDGRAPVVAEAGVELDRARPSAAVLLSPFDNLLWGYGFATRVLGFEHVIEMYKPAPQRRYGYYVLPFLWRDRIVGRADLKSERGDGSLVVKAFHLEPGVRRSRALDEALDRALDRLRRTAGLDRVVR